MFAYSQTKGNDTESQEMEGIISDFEQDVLMLSIVCKVRKIPFEIL